MLFPVILSFLSFAFVRTIIMKTYKCYTYTDIFQIQRADTFERCLVLYNVCWLQLSLSSLDYIEESNNVHLFIAPFTFFSFFLTMTETNKNIFYIMSKTGI